MKEATGGGTNHKPFASGDCLGCHDPHASNNPGMLLADQKTTCLRCHADQAKAAAGSKSVHAAFSSGDCTKCHSPHKASLKKLMLAKPPDVCTTCYKGM